MEVRQATYTVVTAYGTGSTFATRKEAEEAVERNFRAGSSSWIVTNPHGLPKPTNA
jgi:hypothetical protein